MAPISLLLVDDHPAFLRIATNFLQEHYTEEVIVVGAARGGEEGLVQALDLQPDMVLCDLTMPGLTGLETIPRLRAALPDVGIIALSCHEANGYREAALAAGADDFVPKASMISELFPAILRVMQTRQRQEKSLDTQPSSQLPLIPSSPPPLPSPRWGEDGEGEGAKGRMKKH